MTDRERLIGLHTKAQNEWLKKEYDHETDKSLAEYITDHILADGWIRPHQRRGRSEVKGDAE